MKKSLLLKVVCLLICFGQCTTDSSNQKVKTSLINEVLENNKDNSGSWQHSINKIKYTITPDSLRHGRNLLCFHSKKIDILCTNADIYEYTEPKVSNDFLSDEEFNQLTIKEKLYYAANYPETSTQICEKWTGASSGIITFHFGYEYYLLYPSDRQKSIFEEEKDSVIYYLNDCLSNSDYVKTGFKQFLDYADYHMIPYVIDQYHASQDKELLIVLAGLLPRHYKLLESITYKRFEDLEMFERPYIPDTPSNRKQLLEIARSYYSSQVVLEEKKL